MSNDLEWLHKFFINILKQVRFLHWKKYDFTLLFEKSNFLNLKLLENKQIESSKCFTEIINDEANIGSMKQIADIVHKIS